VQGTSKVEKQIQVQPISDLNDRVAFTTTDMPVSKNKNKNKKIMCYRCQKQGHYANECKEDDTTTKTSNKKGSNL